MTVELQRYVEEEILPRYDAFDAAHQRNHAEMVIRQSLVLAEQLGVDVNMAYVVAAYHDTGLCEGRETHHLVSGRIIREDRRLREWFTEEQIEEMARAAEDHRASSAGPPRSIYGRIVAEADRFIDPETIVRRTVQYGLEHYPEMTREEHYRRMMQHLHEKYGRGGYLHLWFEDSPNAARLEQLRVMMEDEPAMQKLFSKYYETAVNGGSNMWGKVKRWLQSLSFRTGVIVLVCCIPFYILSFAQMLLPISAAAKGVLWTILFGLAKTCQYGGLTILGVEGFNRLKKYFKKEKTVFVKPKET